MSTSTTGNQATLVPFEEVLERYDPALAPNGAAR